MSPEKGYEPLGFTQAVTHSNWQSLGTYTLPGGTYDPNQLGLGSLMVRRGDAGNTGRWIGPAPVAVARPFEQSLSIPANWLHVIRWSSTKDWVFYGDNAVAAATRRIGLYVFDRATQQFSWEGAITLTFPAATNHTLRSMRVTYDKHTSGTVAVSGTTVTGTGTTWQTDGACVGNRIGFGSTTAAARDMGITVILADARHSGALEGANIKDPRTIILGSQNDAMNLQIALKARSLNKDIQVVIRIFDEEFAHSLQDQFGLSP